MKFKLMAVEVGERKSRLVALTPADQFSCTDCML